MKASKRTITWVAALAIAGLGATAAVAQMAPFGNAEDTDYAAKLWKAMEAVHMNGPNAIQTLPYEGVEPHGAVLETFYTKATVDGYTGALIVKRNYGPAGVEIETVQADRAKQLGAVTIMFKREAGYDTDNKDWFWAKYLPDGSLDKNPKGMQLAGRVAKGADKGCIACHANAPGENYLFTTDAIQ
ncbi:hypothetical protein MNBD_ALPHA09-1577 [hydrothermal vent metagenome]|uniref:Cytochrome P460 domain-containing protein n=1 Tax=hydrothermal vent metagenome TaxID=652676 RepID=A0A3B0UC59_9ZZZZ